MIIYHKWMIHNKRLLLIIRAINYFSVRPFLFQKLKIQYTKNLTNGKFVNKCKSQKHEKFEIKFNYIYSLFFKWKTLFLKHKNESSTFPILRKQRLRLCPYSLVQNVILTIHKSWRITFTSDISKVSNLGKINDCC